MGERYSSDKGDFTDRKRFPYSPNSCNVDLRLLLLLSCFPAAPVPKRKTCLPETMPQCEQRFLRELWFYFTMGFLNPTKCCTVPPLWSNGHLWALEETAFSNISMNKKWLLCFNSQMTGFLRQYNLFMNWWLSIPQKCLIITSYLETTVWERLEWSPSKNSPHSWILGCWYQACTGGWKGDQEYIQEDKLTWPLPMKMSRSSYLWILTCFLDKGGNSAGILFALTCKCTENTCFFNCHTANRVVLNTNARKDNSCRLTCYILKYLLIHLPEMNS